MTLWKLDPNADLFTALADSPLLWWTNLLADPEVWADIRKKNRINVYYRSGSIMDLSFSARFRAKMHFEYVPIREASTHVQFTFDGSGLDLDRSTVEIPSLDSFSPEVLKRVKKRIGKFNPSGSEKAIQAEFVLANPGFVDTEFQHSKARIDLVWLDVPSKRIIFVELKTIGDSRLYFGQDTSSDNEGIAGQLRKYHDFISGHVDEFGDYYRRLFETKKRLGLLRGLDLDNIDDFVVESRPLLLVGDSTQKWIDDNAEDINSRIRGFALGAFYHGRTTRKFLVPPKTRGNKYVFGITAPAPVGASVSGDQRRRSARRPESVLRHYHAWEPKTDVLDFQWRARLLQAMHRSELGYDEVEYRGALRGALLPMPAARENLPGYLTDTIRAVVRREVEDGRRSKGKLFGKPRIYNNLLSSQPLCFNLFGELAEDIDLATSVFRKLTAGRAHEVTEIGFEVSPGRGDDRYTGDRSAFDVYVRFNGPQGGRGFIGIEVKYHENLHDPAAKLRDRYDEVALEMGAFKIERIPDLKRQPLQQIWRDHLLAGAHRLVDGFDDGFFVFLHPEANAACTQAVESYRDCLTDKSTFGAWTIEDVWEAINQETDAEWVTAFWDRYLNFGKVDGAIEVQP